MHDAMPFCRDAFVHESDEFILHLAHALMREKNAITPHFNHDLQHFSKGLNNFGHSKRTMEGGWSFSTMFSHGRKV
jgi:hypothetical protein